jgi:hypothetical protein
MMTHPTVSPTASIINAGFEKNDMGDILLWIGGISVLP